MRNVTNMKSGIAVAGSILVDKINEISAYPKSGELTQIKSVQKSVGGCVPNVAIDLKRICPEMTVKAVGKIGDDENGAYVTDVFKANGVDVENITFGKDATSFTEVMSITGGQRTFFTYAGASAEFGKTFQRRRSLQHCGRDFTALYIAECILCLCRQRKWRKISGAVWCDCHRRKYLRFF